MLTTGDRERRKLDTGLSPGMPALVRFAPVLLTLATFALFLLTATGFHTYDSISYIRDMGKPPASMLLPHHLLYEPTMFGMYNLWRLLGWTGQADLPGEMLSSLAGASGVGLFFSLASRLCRSNFVALLATLYLALSYGYWFYSVEVDIYVPPLFFLLLAAWLVLHALQEPSIPTHLLLLAGFAHAGAVLLHQAALFIVPAFALGIFLSGGSTARRIRRVASYGAALSAVVVPAYYIAGVVVAGRNTLDSFAKWANSYGELGTWGAFTGDTLPNTVSGASAAVSSSYWVGRLLGLGLLVLVLARAKPITERAGAFAWLLWAWFGIYTLFFAWWQPEVLKFWVLVLPAPLLLATMAFPWQTLLPRTQTVAVSIAIFAVLLLLVSDAPAIWAKRDPMSDPARRTSARLANLSSPEDLIVLQAGSAEHYLPFYYNRINVMSTREEWYGLGGVGHADEAVSLIRRRMWHALAKGSAVWIEDRVLLPGEQTGDHYVFSQEQVDALLLPYGERVQGERVQAGPEEFVLLRPGDIISKDTSWLFGEDQEGWSGVNVGGETFGSSGWCFAPGDDPSLYGLPLKVDTARYGKLLLRITAGFEGKGQLFFRHAPQEAYSEADSVSFDVVGTGTREYTLDIGANTGWKGTVEGLRLDPVERGKPEMGASNSICVARIALLP